MRASRARERKLVTDHDAFGYFAARYGLEVVGTVIPARTTLAQPSAGELARLADTIERERVRAVFPESSVSADVAARSRARPAPMLATCSTATRSGPSRLARRELRRDAGGERRLDRARADRESADAGSDPRGPASPPATTARRRCATSPSPLERGTRVGVLGPNGGGKTTLFRVLLGELPPAAGTVALDGRCGTVPQTERSRLDYPVSALDVALMGALPRLAWWRRPGRAERRAAL